MRLLLAHVVHSPGVDQWYMEIAAAAGDDLDVVCFPVTLDPPGPRLSWEDLDRRWRLKDRKLLAMYQRLQQAAEHCDVLLLYNGANIHPEYLHYLPTFNVYCCFDDPESSEEMSQPVAAAFDAVFYGNIAARFQYEQWGCKKLAWLPIFTAPSDVPIIEDGPRMLAAQRDFDISLVCEKNSMRRQRLEMLSAAFPQAKCYGSGWANGRISDTELKQLYSSTRIGWNIHNSSGPINRRMFSLAGFGVLQICDNKTGLGHIFELGTEVVGFDTIPEAIELTRYYLAHEGERGAIAAAGWQRFWKNYHAGAIWQRIRGQLEVWLAEGSSSEKRSMRPLPASNPAALLGPCIASGRLKIREFRSAMRSFVDAWHASDAATIAVLDERILLGEQVPAYIENPEMHGVNMARERSARGEPFEWPNILALNWAVTSLIRDAKKIIDIGSGTGPFAHFSAVDRGRTIHCFEEDDFARGWAEKNRDHPNVSYFSKCEGNLAVPYDLLVSLDVFEHVDDMRGFLSFCSSLAPRAVFSTPNRDVLRPCGDMGPPSYPPHVREFDPGEFYWILRQYYRHAVLYYMPDVYVPWLEPMSIHTRGTPIVAECWEPLDH
jgi:spore maturation protein CgeB